MKKYSICGLLLCVLLFGCDFLMGPDTPVGGGNLTISLGAGEGRAITTGAGLTDAILETLRYELTLTGPGGEVLERTVTGGETLNLTVPLGEWRIAAKAYKEDGLAGIGNLSFTVKPGRNAVWVPMDINGGYFDITVDSSMSNGTVTASCDTAFPETTITLTVTPDPGYDLKAGTLKYSYDGSDYEPTGSGLIYIFTMPTDSVTVYAEFEVLPPETYSITAAASISHGTVSPDVNSAAAGTTITLTVMPDTGYVLQTGSVTYNDGSDHSIAGPPYTFTMPTAHVTVSAEFEAIVYTVSGTITTDDPAGPASNASVQLKQGSTNVGNAVSTNGSGDYTIPSIPAGTGYTIEVSLSGYTTGTISSFNITTVNVTDKDLMLGKITETVYTVSGTITTDDPAGPASNASVQLKQGSTNVGNAVSTDVSGDYTIPSVPAGTGYTIEVSLTGYTTGTISSFNITTVNVTDKDLILVKSYTVTFNANGGTSIPAQTVPAGGKVTEPTDPTKANHTFGGWYKETALTNQWDFDMDIVTADITLYAKWTWLSTFTTPAEYRNMVPLTGGTITGSSTYYYDESANNRKGVFVEGRTVMLSPFSIAKYETTYELWYEVRTWAAGNGYTFDNEGREGHDGTDGDSPTTAAKTEPVTNIKWGDAVVWCNAYSEMSGKEPVYYTDTTYATILKTSINTAADNPKIKPAADGYRLPTEAEWEYAARGSDPSAPSFANKWAGTNTESDLENYAWYSFNSGNVTHTVGGKMANAGLYDMSGNVNEYCWDYYTSTISTGTETDPSGPASGITRVFRGGGTGAPLSCAVAFRVYGGNTYTSVGVGFRVVCVPAGE